MARSETRYVKTTDANVFVSTSRVQEEPIQVFDLPGPVYNTRSGRWSPAKNASLTSWYVSSSTVGTVDLWVILCIGDNVANAETGDDVGVLVLPADSRFSNGNINTTLPFGNIVVRTDQWISIGFSDNTGHTDVTVQLYGRYL